MTVKYGIVKWFNNEKGFGFISTEDGEDVFVLSYAIEESIKGLTEGEKVSLELENSKRGLQARNVKRLETKTSIYVANEHMLFPEDQAKIDKAVSLYPMGSYQIGEIARISALLYDRGVDVINHLEKLQNGHGIKNKYL